MFESKSTRKLIGSLVGSHKAFTNKIGQVQYQPAMADGRLLFWVSYRYRNPRDPYKWGYKNGTPMHGGAAPTLTSRRKADKLALKEARMVFRRDYVNSFESLYPEKDGKR